MYSSFPYNAPYMIMSAYIMFYFSNYYIISTTLGNIREYDIGEFRKQTSRERENFDAFLNIWELFGAQKIEKKVDII